MKDETLDKLLALAAEFKRASVEHEEKAPDGPTQREALYAEGASDAYYDAYVSIQEILEES